MAVIVRQVPISALQHLRIICPFDEWPIITLVERKKQSVLATLGRALRIPPDGEALQTD